jgi:hypothetical protein
VTRRCAGGRWRLLVHDRLPRRTPDGILYGDAHSAGSTRELAGEDREGHHATVLEDTEFDELVVGRFLRAEQLDEGLWQVDVGGLVVHVRAGRDGNPVSVSAELEPVEGVKYDLRVQEAVMGGE